MATVRITVIDHIPVMACMAVMGQGPMVTGRMVAGIVPVVVAGTDTGMANAE